MGLNLTCGDCYMAQRFTNLTHCPKHGTDEEKAANRKRAHESIGELARNPPEWIRMVMRIPED